MKGANLILVGMMGSGKTTVGRELSHKLRWDFVDFDEVIEKKAGKSIPQIFVQEGEKYFRDLETQAIKEFKGRHSVIATGGGAMQKEENIALLENLGITVYLKADAKTLWGRIQEQTQHRPLANGNFEDFDTLLKRREPTYNRAQVVITAQDRSVVDIVEEIYANINS